MTKSTRNVLFLACAVLLIIVSVQRLREFGSRYGYHALLPGSSDSPQQAARNTRRLGTSSAKIRHEDGRTLLWARGAMDAEDSEWFDITDSPLEPGEFQYGIGKDEIAAIDQPQFLDAGDPRLRDHGITDDTRVIGFEHAGEARAYSIEILNDHELVNDRVGGKPVTVGW